MVIVVVDFVFVCLWSTVLAFDAAVVVCDTVQCELERTDVVI